MYTYFTRAAANAERNTRTDPSGVVTTMATEAVELSPDVSPEGLPEVSPLAMPPELKALPEVEAALPLFCAVLLFFAACTALGFVLYYFVNLSDLGDDLINPYTLCSRVNSKLRYELFAHVAILIAFLMPLYWVGLVLSLPGLALRALWHQQKKLVIDATSCYNDRIQSGLRTRWGILAVCHGITVLFGFVQLMMHLVLALGRNLPADHHQRKLQFAAMSPHTFPLHHMI